MNRALIIGVPELKGRAARAECVNDALDIAGYLTYRWRNSQHSIRVLLDAETTRRAAILGELATLARLTSNPDDLAFVHFGGHGTTRRVSEAVDKSVLCASDFSAADLSSGIDREDLVGALAGITDGALLLTIEACYSGQFAEKKVVMGFTNHDGADPRGPLGGGPGYPARCGVLASCKIWQDSIFFDVGGRLSSAFVHLLLHHLRMIEHAVAVAAADPDFKEPDLRELVDRLTRDLKQFRMRPESDVPDFILDRPFLQGPVSGIQPTIAGTPMADDARLRGIRNFLSSRASSRSYT